MQFPWLPANAFFLTVHGSQAYGLNHSLSDLDVKGVCIPPPEVRDHLFQGFEQAENAPEINTSELVKPRVNPLNPKVESNVYTLKKFFKLAADVNPNIIETLFTDPGDHLQRLPIAEDLMAIRDQFISSKAKFTFTGYAVAQLNKINRHRKWLLNPVTEKPKREDFGLPAERPMAVETVAREIRKLVEEWNFHQYRLDDLERSELKERCWEVIYRVANAKVVDWDNWPDEYWKAALDKLQEQLNLSDELRAVIDREHQYQRANQAYESYLRWESGRNPERKALEAKYGYDVKHSMHLVRLLRMGIEILETGQVNVKRSDAEELIRIRNGGWSYDALVAYAESMQKRIDDVYKVTKLPRTVNHVKLNTEYHRMLEKWDSGQGR
ncbi:hypothetical protein EKK58_01170 [Candidatus Dependentiae bacterium]|nr:MAG: hypothetical protein EKK58_01170 [Candidatus Dependentiae bacterium]